MQFESLHNHTTLSDGLLDHFQFLDKAAQSGFGVVAFTDHDVLPDKALLDRLHAYNGPVKWFLGCEISSGWPSEIGNDTASMFHILGLFTDPFDKALGEHSRLTLEARRERMEKLVTNFSKQGFTITTDDVLRFAGGESVGKPHVVSALMSHPENLERLEYFIQEFRTEAAKDPERAKLLQDTETRCQDIGDKSQFFYPLFMFPDSLVPDVYVPYLYEVDMDKAVKLIRDAGGKAFIAHWGTVKKRIDEATLRELISSKRVDGLEVATGFVGVDSEDDYAVLSRIAEATQCATEIGVDAHSAEDLDRFITNQALAERTIGQTQRLITAFRPDLTHSNLSA